MVQQLFYVHFGEILLVAEESEISLVIASLKYSNYNANWNVHPCRVKLPSSSGDHQSPSRIPIQLPMLNKNRVGELERFH